MPRTLRSPRWLLAGVAVALAATGLGVLARSTAVRGRTSAPTLAANAVQKGPPPSDHGNHWPATLPGGPLPTPQPNLCGTWSESSSSNVVAAEQQHGILQDCAKIEQYWVVSTQRSGLPGEVGTLDCGSDSSCLDGRNFHDLASFTWTTAPYGTALIWLQQLPSDPLELIFATGGSQVAFDVQTNIRGLPNAGANRPLRLRDRLQRSNTRFRGGPTARLRGGLHLRDARIR